MESDPTRSGESPKILLAREAVTILNQAIDKIDDNDIVSAKVMVGIALYHLESLKMELDDHLSWEKRLREIIKQA